MLGGLCRQSIIAVAWLFGAGGHEAAVLITPNLLETGGSAGVLQVMTSERGNGILLIEVFERFVNTQNNGHQGSMLAGRFY
jgi:hypothetical protein